MRNRMNTSSAWRSDKKKSPRITPRAFSLVAGPGCALSGAAGTGPASRHRIGCRWLQAHTAGRNTGTGTLAAGTTSGIPGPRPPAVHVSERAVFAKAPTPSQQQTSKNYSRARLGHLLLLRGTSLPDTLHIQHRSGCFQPASDPFPTVRASLRR